MDKMKMQSLDVIGSNIQKIAQLFPNCVTEHLGKEGNPELGIDFEKLQAELSNDIIPEGAERYQFTWPDKRAAVRLANTPTTMTLRPCREESVDFDNTQNLYIEGDNLDVLKVLRETYLGKVKMIYIDPPYNTGNDFVYNDDFSESYIDFAESCKIYDGEGNLLFDPIVNGESNGRFHTDWLNMMYPRLKVAKDLLSDNGVIFFSIGEEEVSNAITMCNEIFGVSNTVSKIARVSKTASNMGTYFAPSIDFILCYAKDINNLPAFVGEVDESLYTKIEKNGPRKGEKYRDDVALYQASLTLERSRNARYFINCPDGSKCIPPENKRWRVVEDTVLELLNNNMIVFKETKTSPLFDENGNRSKWNLYTKSYLSDRKGTGTLPRNYIDKFINRQGADLIKKYGIPFDFAKPVGLIKYLMEIINDSNGYILDFFSGSATTAHAVMKLNAEDGGNRKFIMVQLPEKTDEKSEAYKAGYKNICEIGKERIRRVGKKVKEEAGLQGQNLDTGFRVLKLDSSNMEEVYYTPQEFSMGSLFNENVKADRSNEDLLFQVMLDLGIELSAKIEAKQIAGKQVHIVDEGYLVACFDRDVNESTIIEIAKQQPVYFVMRDASAANDNVIDNFEQIFRHYSPDTSCRII